MPGLEDLPDVAYSGRGLAGLPDVPYQAPGPSMRERAGAAIRGAAQAVTFGGADELRAAVRGGIRSLGPGEFQKLYDEELSKAREEDKRLGERAPGAYLGGSVAGALLTAPVMPAARAATLPALAAQGARVGAMAGAAQGFGAGEGGVRARLESAGRGAIAGAAIGAAAGPAVRVAGDAANALLGRAPRVEGQRMLQAALREEGGDIAGAIRQANQAGVREMTLPDVSRRARELVRDVGASPNPMQAPVREFYGRRQAGELVPGRGYVGGQMNELTGTLRDLTGAGGKRALATLDNIVEERRAVAGPLFRQAEQFDPSQSPALRGLWSDLIQTDAGKRALATTRRLWSNEFPGQPFPIADPRNASAVPDMRIFKLFKESLDDEVSRLYRGGQNQLAISTRTLRDRLRDTLRTENPVYGQALDEFAGRKAMEEALEQGRKVLSTEADAVEQQLAGMGASEREMYRIGAVTQLTDRLRGKAPTEMADFTQELRKPDVLRRMHALLPDQAAREQFDQILLARSGQSQTAATFGGSQTQPRQEVARDVERGRAVIDFLLSLPSSLAMGLLRAGSAVSERVRGIDASARRAELGRLLTARDEEAAALAERLMRAGPTVAQRSATPGGMLGGAIAPQMQGMLGPMPELLELPSFGVPGVGVRRPLPPPDFLAGNGAALRIR